jgi:prepilin-type N-terminal cleavage/methylation domain-containing protein
MSLNNIKKMKAERGFTIVELLIVIVVIGILVAITLVAYNGIQNRARTTSAEAAAQTVVKKAEAYNAEEGVYPDAFTDLTGAAASETYSLAGTNITTGTPAQNEEPDVITFAQCPDSPATPTGVSIGYRNYNDDTNATMTAGSGC